LGTSFPPSGYTSSILHLLVLIGYVEILFMLACELLILDSPRLEVCVLCFKVYCVCDVIYFIIFMDVYIEPFLILFEIY
jgi:hypothetical protein